MTSWATDKARLEAGIETCAALIASLSGQVDTLATICDVMVGALQSGNKIMTAGNGGSAAEALHMSEELVGRFRGDRISLPAIALTADATALTCIGNDYGFEHIFSRQVEGLGAAGDVLVLFSTSGNSANLSAAMAAAQARDITTICLLGRDGGAMAGRGTYELVVAGKATERIQEAHQLILHLMLDAVECAFPPSETASC